MPPSNSGDRRHADAELHDRALGAHLPHELLGPLSERIIDEMRGLKCAAFDIAGKPPTTIEWEWVLPAVDNYRYLSKS